MSSYVFFEEWAILGLCAEARFPTVAQSSTFPLQSLPAAALITGNAYWWPILAIAYCPLDAGHTDVMTDTHDRSIADSNSNRSLEQKLKKDLQTLETTKMFLPLCKYANSLYSGCT